MSFETQSADRESKRLLSECEKEAFLMIPDTEHTIPQLSE